MAPSANCALYLASFFLVTLLHEPHLLTAVQTKLTTGSVLAPPNYITSSSGDFAFGFRALNSDQSQFLLAIWFNVDPTDKKVVWFASNSASPDSFSTVIATEQSALRLTSEGQLSLISDITGSTILWSPGPEYGSALLLQDSGSLQFFRNNGSLLWESFQYPTDTLLPGQTMKMGMFLQSKNTETDFSPGRFSFRVQTDGNIVLYMKDFSSVVYDPYKDTSTNEKAPTLLFADPGNLYYKLALGNDTTSHNLTALPPNSTAKSYWHATLDPDGTIRVYGRPKGIITPWQVTGLFPADGEGCSRKSGYGLQGMCGPNAYCTVSSEAQRLDCECPSSYVFVDAQYRYKGCRPSFVPHNCDGKNHSSEFLMVEIPNTAWSSQSAYMLYPSVIKDHPVTKEQCRENCLNDCFCVAALLVGGNCTAVGMLTAGKQTSGIAMSALVKVRTSYPHVPVSRNSIVLYLVIGILVLLLLGFIIHIIAQHCNRAKRSLSSLIIFTHKELNQATNGFSELLGKGGFGEVYRGEVKSLPLLKPEVAVKKLISSNKYSEKGFENEMRSIGRIHHKNLVRMVGYCNEGMHLMLVFEYMQGGTLSNFIFGPERPCWSSLAEAVNGIARGLEYG